MEKYVRGVSNVLVSVSLVCEFVSSQSEVRF